MADITNKRTSTRSGNLKVVERARHNCYRVKRRLGDPAPATQALSQSDWSTPPAHTRSLKNLNG